VHPSIRDALERAATDDRLRRTYRRSLRGAAGLSLIPYMEALARRTTWIRRWSAFLEQWPILLIPTAFEAPFPQEVATRSASAVSGIRESMMPSAVLPILGLPALAVPTGTDGGLPTGVQLVADRFREDLILEAGQVLENAFGLLTPIEPR
jgi:amidase